MDAKPKRRWYQFSLRTMFVGMTLVSIPLARVGYSLNWMKERRAIIDRGEVSIVDSERSGVFAEAPGLLWIFGEDGVEEIEYSTASQLDQEMVQRLFPEAHIVEVP